MSVNLDWDGSATRVQLTDRQNPQLVAVGESILALGGVKGDRTQLNRGQLEAWLRDPPAEKPMDPEDERGMPNLGLTEAEIDNLIAYLETLE